LNFDLLLTFEFIIMAKEKKQSLLGKVRTRIAPSPTGDPHVGTAFQALFNWVYARRYDGQFLMRLEDTDQKRLQEGVESNLHEAFSWLGIEPDEDPIKGGPVGPYRQSERLEIYQKYAQLLVEQGVAYYCFCSQERLAEVREKQRQAGIPPKYDRLCRELPVAEALSRIEAGEKAVIRMKIPDQEKIEVQDVLRGKVTFDSDTIDDQVLIKSDGFPTYHLAVVVDDHLMKITHIVRGEEWLPSSPKHILLYRYFNWSVPELIHTPTLRNPDRSKLSKRKGNTSLWWYREQGYLPQAMLNFLGLMVWKPNETQEIFSLEEMINKFEWREMNITGPIFDVKKLDWLNGKYLRQLSSEELTSQFSSWLAWVQEKGVDQENSAKVAQLSEWQSQNSEMFKQALLLSVERARKFIELFELMQFYFVDELTYEQAELLQKQQPSLMSQALSLVAERLAKLEKYNQENWEKTIREIADETGLTHKKLFMSLRTAITAEKFTPPLYEVMEVLGKEVSFNRIRQAINYLNSI
jgi:glutamyl-tRNA synthetase